MKKTFYFLIGFFVVLFILLILNQRKCPDLSFKSVPGSCTIFSASIGGKVLFGNNEDYRNPNTYCWIEPANEGNYGCIFLGFENNSIQGGMNEKGLCFDANSLPDVKLNPHAELLPPPSSAPPYEKHWFWAPIFILKKAATVEEAMNIAVQYRRENWDGNSGFLSYQVNIADEKGDAVIISADKTGELVFTRKGQGEKYLVSTNFNKTNPKNAWSYPCWRYKKAVEMLKKIKDKNDLSVDFFKSILDSVHVEGRNTNTLYSNVFDLKNRIMYLYYWHQYDEVIVMNVNEELAKGGKTICIKKMFSNDTVDRASKEYQRYRSKNN
ncbi:hypothetical protein KAR48_03245 [bacterium]|nr:hypothetical protein [bacterium]